MSEYIVLEDVQHLQPEDATHFRPEDEKLFAVFLKKRGDKWLGKAVKTPENIDEEWVFLTLQHLPETLKYIIKLPDKPQKSKCSIKIEVSAMDTGLVSELI